MVSRTIVQFSDDVDGGTENVRTVRFALDGVAYEIDLSSADRDAVARR